MSSIEWTDETWNPVRGCTRVSPGCENCYAERQAHRQSGPGGAYEGLTQKGPHYRKFGTVRFGSPRWTGKIRLVPELLDKPLHWRKPRRVFVNSMSDLFHEDVSDEFISRVLAVCAHAPQHTFQILTKRADRMREFVHRWDQGERSTMPLIGVKLPLPNVWLGVSCEDQKRFDERWELLKQTPATVRFLSLEPLLSRIDISAAVYARDRVTWDGRPGAPHDHVDECHWVIVGGESGPGARPCHVEWIRDIVKQCREAQVPCFVKQLGAKPEMSLREWRRLPVGTEKWTGHEGVAHDDDALGIATLGSRKGSDPSEWPEALRVREMPA